MPKSRTPGFDERASFRPLGRTRATNRSHLAESDDQGLVVWLRDRVRGLPDPVVVVGRRRRRRHVPWPRGNPQPRANPGVCTLWPLCWGAPSFRRNSPVIAPERMLVGHGDRFLERPEAETMSRLIGRSIAIAVAVVSIAISMFVWAIPTAQAAGGPVNCVSQTHQGACYEFVWVNGVEVRMTFSRPGTRSPTSRMPRCRTST